jgi:hypothetical protein
VSEAAPKLYSLTEVARRTGTARRSVRRAAAEGRLTLVQLGEDDSLGKPRGLRIVADEKLANWPPPRYRKPTQ